MHIITSDLYRRTGRFDPAQQKIDQVSALLAGHPNMKEKFGSLIELQQDAIGKKLTVRVEVERARRK
jgi:hypothetical protein